jgi:protein-tyrosine phosphatase
VAEALLRHRLAAAGVEAVVRSAGLLESGNPASASGVDILAGRGLEMKSHRSTTVSTAILQEADLVLGMARQHVREAVVLAPEVWPRTFTLKELVRRGAAIGPRKEGEPLEAWLARAHMGRSTALLMGAAPEDDVADPIGQPRSAYETMVEELDDLVERLVALAWPVRVDGQRGSA